MVNWKWAPAPPDFSDLSSSQVDAIQAAATLALRGIADAISILKRARTSPVPRVASHFKISETSQKSRIDLELISANYHRMAGALLGHEKLYFEGESSGPYGVIGDWMGRVLFNIDPAAYAYNNEPVVHLVKKKVFGHSPVHQARIIIHELGHALCDLNDKKYYGSGTAINVSRKEALRNADSYAYFALPVTSDHNASLKISLPSN